MNVAEAREKCVEVYEVGRNEGSSEVLLSPGMTDRSRRKRSPPYPSVFEAHVIKGVIILHGLP
jgi:hypothetical protein